MIPRRWQQKTRYGVVTVVTSEHGVRAIGLPDDDGMPDDDCALDDDVKSERDDDIARRLDDWFEGRSEVLEIPLDLTGVDGFKRAVLETLVRDVGWGETVSYGELAEMAGRPRAARAVGSAMASNPLPFVIPCHRVIASGGRIGGYGGTRDAVALEARVARA